ncbi:MAG: hypothetical protein AAF732_19455 [Pseudomonadota bacterium]
MLSRKYAALEHHQAGKIDKHNMLIAYITATKISSAKFVALSFGSSGKNFTLDADAVTAIVKCIFDARHARA